MSVDLATSIRLTDLIRRQPGVALSVPPTASIRAWRVSLATREGALVSAYVPASLVGGTDYRPRPEQTVARCAEYDHHVPPAPGCICGLRGTTSLRGLDHLARGVDEVRAGRNVQRDWQHRHVTTGRPVIHSVELLRAWHLDTSCMMEVGDFGQVVDWPGTVRAARMVIDGPVYAAAATPWSMVEGIRDRYGVPVRVLDRAPTMEGVARWIAIHTALGHRPGANSAGQDIKLDG